jgi:hypothetical protein
VVKPINHELASGVGYWLPSGSGVYLSVMRRDKSESQYMQFNKYFQISWEKPLRSPCYGVTFDDWWLVDEGDYSSSSPSNSPCAWWMTSPLGTPRGRCDEYSSWFSLNYETKVYRSWRGETSDWRWCLLVCDSCGQFIYGASSKLCLLAATWNLHIHKQVLCSQLTMRLSISPVCLKQRLWVYRVENSKSMRVK